MPIILVADDDASIRKMICAYLKSEGYGVLSAANGREALDILASAHTDLLIVDIMMPEMDGYSLTRELRAVNRDIPILIVTARQTLEDKRNGFRIGADDYMVKPVDLDEMLLRIEALLRRAKINTEHQITVGKVALDSDSLTVRSGDVSIELPKKEFYLLFKLLSYPGKIFTRRQLMDDIWGMDADTDERTVDVHIKRIRDKFEGFPEFEIITVRGLGYKVEKRTS